MGWEKIPPKERQHSHSEKFAVMYSYTSEDKHKSDPLNVYVYSFRSPGANNIELFAEYLQKTQLPLFLVYEDGRYIDLAPYHDKAVYSWNIEDLTQYNEMTATAVDRKTTVPVQLIEPGTFFPGMIPGVNRDIVNQSMIANRPRPLEHFEMWAAGENESGLKWDADTWMLVAINRRAKRKETIEELERLGVVARKGRGLAIEKCVDELLAWDLNEAGFTHVEIAEKISNVLTTERKIAKWVSSANKKIRGGYRTIR
ncbi:MAG: hypothetical protein ABIH23_24455 [bacterium]